MKNPVKKSMDKLRKPQTHRDRKKFNSATRPFLNNSVDFDEYLEYVLDEKMTLKRKRPRIDPIKKEEAEDLLARGFSYKEITRRTGISKGTLTRMANRMVPPAGGSEG